MKCDIGVIRSIRDCGSLGVSANLTCHLLCGLFSMARYSLPTEYSGVQIPHCAFK